MPYSITEKTTDPATTVYASATTSDDQIYLDSSGTGSTSYTIKFGQSVDTDIFYSVNGSGIRTVVGTRPRGSGH